MYEDDGKILMKKIQNMTSEPKIKILMVIAILALLGLVLLVTGGCTSRRDIKNSMDVAFQLGYYRGRNDCHEQANAEFYKNQNQIPIVSTGTLIYTKPKSK